MSTDHDSRQSLFEVIDCFAEQNKLIDQNKTVILGFSGGPDSRFLLEWFLSRTKNNNRIILAHLNHEWRPEADQEEQHCFLTAQKLGLTFVTKKISAYQDTIKYNGSKEAFAREARRRFLEQLAQEQDALIALGHHQDDQLETFFIRLARGTTGAGLVGMQPKNGVYIRPLLKTTKDQILTMLHYLNIEYCNDSSNESKDYLRNNIRLSLIPVLNTIDQRFKNNIIQTMNHLSEAEKALVNQTKTVLQSLEFKKDNNRCLINKQGFLSLDSYLQKRILIDLLIKTGQRVTFQNSMLEEIIRFFSNKSSQHRISKMLSVNQTKEYFWFCSHTD